MNVLIVNGYSARNRGDGMIISQMARLFSARGCSVRVMSDDPADAARYSVPRVEPLVRTWPSGGKRPSRFRLLGAVARAHMRPPVGNADIQWADVCVSAGGGYLYDDGSRAARLNLVLRLLPLRTAHRAGKQVVLFSQSIGPFASRRLGSLVARALANYALVIVREEISASMCADLGLRNVSVCDDIAFALEPSTPPGNARDLRGEVTVGVTVVNALPGVDAAGYARYREALAQGLIGALRGRDEKVAVISQVSAHAGDDDVRAGRELAQRLREADISARFINLGDVTDEEVAAVYGQLRLVVASRLHSAILALCAQTPVLALSYLPKTDGVFARMAMSDMVLPARRLEAARLETQLRAALADAGQLAARVRAKLPEMRASAASAVDLTLDAASSHRSSAAASR